MHCKKCFNMSCNDPCEICTDVTRNTSIELLKNKLKYSLDEDTSKFTIDNIKELLKNKFEESNFESLKADIIPFVDLNYNINNIDKNMFINSIEYLECD